MNLHRKSLPISQQKFYNIDLNKIVREIFTFYLQFINTVC